MKRLFIIVLALFILQGICFACTFVEVGAKDGSVAIGRTVEWSFPMNYILTITPKGQNFTGFYPKDKVADDYQPLKWCNKYAYAGIGTTQQEGIVSGQNEKGINIEGLNLPSFSEYQTVTKESKNILSLADLGGWALGNFATVKELSEALQKCTLWTPPVADSGSGTIHLVATDRTGSGIVIEYVKGQLKIYDNVTHTLTNSPTYDWHLTNLRNYLRLDNQDTTSVNRGNNTLKQISTGNGLSGLPGDYTSVSRFVKITTLRYYSIQPDTAQEACGLAGHLINAVNIPKGAIAEKYQGEPVYETAQITVVKDLTNNKLFVTDYEHALDFCLIDLNRLFSQDKKIGPVPFSNFLTHQPVEITDLIK